MTDPWAISEEVTAEAGGGPGSGFGADLHLDLSAGRGLRAGLVDALREAARSGRLAPGTRLPSSRTFAADLGIARNTVAEAYAELVAEGWLTARQGSGTRVAERARPLRPAGSARVRHPAPRRHSYSLVPGTPDLGAFPRAAWLTAARRALAQRRTRPSGTRSTRAAGWSCARPSPDTWRGRAGCTRTPSGSCCARGSRTR